MARTCANLVNEAALYAARRNCEQVDYACFEATLARVQLGALRPLAMTETERRILAYHEGGHALVAHYLKEAETVNWVTILPRGQSLGVTQLTAEEDRYHFSREMLMAKIAVGLGGRVAEELTLGRDRVTTGAENDFRVVTALARRMVTRWGMSDEVGVVVAGDNETGADLKGAGSIHRSSHHVRGRRPWMPAVAWFPTASPTWSETWPSLWARQPPDLQAAPVWPHWWIVG